MKKPWAIGYPWSAQRILCSDWADVQADFSLRWAPSHFVGFVLRQLIYANLSVTKKNKTSTSFMCVMRSGTNFSYFGYINLSGRFVFD